MCVCMCMCVYVRNILRTYFIRLANFTRTYKTQNSKIYVEVKRFIRHLAMDTCLLPFINRSSV